MDDCGFDDSDKGYVLQRYKNEGLRFLTVTLPKLIKAVLYSTEIGYFDRTGITDFAWKGRSLRNFRSFLSQIFKPDGTLSSDHQVVASAIAVLRQFAEYLYKLCFDLEDSDINKATEQYLCTEKENAEASRSFNRDYVRQMRKAFHRYYPASSNSTVERIFAFSRPRFTAGSFVTDDKSVPYWKYKMLPDRDIGTTRHEFRAFSGYFRPYPSAPEPIRLASEGLTSQVLLVPKDARGPRVISKEPLFLLKAQMSLFDFMVNALEKDTGNRINFLDQSINQRLAKESSLNRCDATFDLKEASDRVLYRLALDIFKYAPHLHWFLTKCRSTHTIVRKALPSRRGCSTTKYVEQRIQLHKLAGMGSGLTFPLMALIIHLACCTRISRRTGIPYKQVMPRVYVYGDDLIFPREWRSYVEEGLTLANLRVNTQKSFSRGFFRESCGADYYFGTDVTPVRLKLTRAKLGSVRHYRRSDSIRLGIHGMVQLERHCRELSRKGLYSLREYYYSRIERSGIHLPTVSGDSPVLGRYEVNPQYVSLKSEVGYVPGPALEEFDEACPYKYLSKVLGRESDLHVSISRTLPDLKPGTMEYGVAAQPYALSIRRRLVCHLEKQGLSN